MIEMSFGIFEHVEMSGLCVALPTQSYDTKSVSENMDEKALKRFIKSTGVENRFLASKGQLASDLCFVAAEKLFASLNIERSEIEACIFISQTPDYKAPSTAIILQERLGLSKECLAFDINLGCSGYVYGIYTMAALIESGAVKKGLLLVGDVCFDNMTDKILFGDAGSATVLEFGSGIVGGLMRSDGSGFKKLYIPNGGQRHPYQEDHFDLKGEENVMDGSGIFEFSIQEVPKLLNDFNALRRSTWEDYDYVVLHQANLMILNHITKKLSIPSEKVPVSIRKYGNVNGGSIPITIVDLVQDKHLTGKLSFLLSGFGVGLSWGCISIMVDASKILPFVHSDYVWDEQVRGEK